MENKGISYDNAVKISRPFFTSGSAQRISRRHQFERRIAVVDIRLRRS
jgi:hypothetical protein